MFFPDNIMRTTEATIKVSENASYQTEWLSALTNNSRMNIGIFIAFIAVIIIWFMMKKTTLGYEIISVGINPHAAEYAGMSAKTPNYHFNDYLRSTCWSWWNSRRSRNI